LHGDYISLVAKYSDVGRVPGYIWLTEIVGEENIIAPTGGDRWFTDRRYGYYCDDRADNQSFRCSSSNLRAASRRPGRSMSITRHAIIIVRDRDDGGVQV